MVSVLNQLSTGGRKTINHMLLSSAEVFRGSIFTFKYQTHSRVVSVNQVDLCFDYYLPVGENGRGFDQ